ncbi:hypothetical protein OQA88_6035 [Cercophora sp. LCS_1]
MFSPKTLVFLLATTALASPLAPRGECNTVTVKSGDSCSSLVTACNISVDNFYAWNPSPTLCSTLVPGQQICCSAGTLPDNTPKPNPHGICYQYVVKPDDSCWAISERYGLTVQKIEDFNKGRAGWKGCGSLWVGDVLCLSTGRA